MLRLRVRIPSLVGVVRCKVEVSAIGRSLVQQNPWPTRDCQAIGRGGPYPCCVATKSSQGARDQVTSQATPLGQKRPIQQVIHLRLRSADIQQTAVRVVFTNKVQE